MWNSIKILHKGHKPFIHVELPYKDLNIRDLLSPETILTGHLNIEIFSYKKMILQENPLLQIDFHSYIKDGIPVFSEEDLPIISENQISKEKYIKFLKEYVKKYIIKKTNVSENILITKEDLANICFKFNHLECVRRLIEKENKLLYALTYIKKNFSYTIEIFNLILKELSYKSEDVQLNLLLEIKEYLVLDDLLITIKLITIKSHNKKILFYFQLAHEFLKRYKSKLAVTYFINLQKLIINQPCDELKQYIKYQIDTLIKEENWKTKIETFKDEYVFYQKEKQIKINKFWIDPIPSILQKISTISFHDNNFIIKNIIFTATQPIYNNKNQLFNYLPETLNKPNNIFSDSITMKIFLKNIIDCKNCSNGCNKNKIRGNSLEIEVLQLITEDGNINIFKKMNNNITINFSHKTNFTLKEITYRFNYKLYKYTINPIKFKKIEIFTRLKIAKNKIKVLTDKDKYKIYAKGCKIEEIKEKEYKITEKKENAEIHIQVNEDHFQKYII